MSAHWRLGFPGWRIAAHLGFSIKVQIDICFDEEAKVYFATSDEIGLAVESESLDGVMKEIHAAMPALLELAHSPAGKTKADIRVHDGLVLA